MAKFTLKKQEILSGIKQISELFQSGKSVYSYPLKAYYKKNDAKNSFESKVLFSVTVPKRNFAKAVERNLLKRRLRESYRLNKYELINKVRDDDQLIIMFVYIGKKIENYQTIERAVKKNLRDISEKT